ncbi:MAG TPA: efflux RND transporter periplasmic adaptor subunit [Verrucomicrobiae bacterium]|nr:efflux RND transporter periplasmic adaptor subunit [Verrucomicrobiae bacterium]
MKIFRLSRVLAGGTALTGALLLTSCEKKAAKPPTPPPAEVSVLTVTSETVPLRTELPGRINSTREAQVRARATGILLKRLFEEGANVKEGDVLFEIDPAPMQAQLNSAQAALARTQAGLKESRAKVERYKELVQINAVSKQVFDEASATLGQYEAELLANQAAIATAQLNLGYTKVTAPISGRIGKALVTEGALVSATDATQLAVIRQLDPVYLDITQSSTDVLRLRKAVEHGGLNSATPGQAEITVLLEDGSEYPHPGKLLFSDVSVDPSTGMITLRAQVPNPENVLLPGMFARAWVVQGVITNAVTIPQRTVARGAAGVSSVLVVDDQNKVELRKITINREIGSKVIVANGLKAGERIIVEGSQKALPGSVVKPVPFEPVSIASSSGAEKAK